jgi:hypothetical protein
MSSSKKEVSEYRVVQAPTLTQLSELVMSMISEGWQPTGGAQSAQGSQYAQTLIKYKAESSLQESLGKQLLRD